MIKKVILMAAAALSLTAASSSCGTTVSVADLSSSDTALETPAESTEEIISEGFQEQTTEAPEPVLYEVDTTVPEGYNPAGSCVLEGFEAVLQEPELPTGCEITALTQTINYLGYDIDKVDLADNYMPIDFSGVHSMREAYIGDPKANNGFGCLAPAIVRTADDYFASVNSPCYAVDLTESSLYDLFWQIDQGRPVVTWATVDLKYGEWLYQFNLPSGEEFWFNYYQHCVTVYGYDMDSRVVYVADPLKGNMEYDMDTFQQVYDFMNKNAVVLCGNSQTDADFVPRPDKPESDAVPRNQQIDEQDENEGEQENYD